MRFTSNILGDLGRTIGLATPGLQETELNIPADVDLVIPPITALDLAQNGQFTNQEVTQSIAFTIAFSVSNAGSANAAGPILQKGLWKIDISISYVANYTNLGANNIVTLQTASGSKIAVLATTWPGTATVQVFQTHWISISDPLQAIVSLAGNGVGNAHAIAVAWLATRCL